MPLSVNTLKTVFSKVNSKGASLLRKDKALDVANAFKEGLRSPEGAKTYDAVRVGRNFKPQESYTDVFTFRDENGQIVKRYIKQVDPDKVKETTKGYEQMYPWEKDLDVFGDEFLEIPATKVRSYVRENGKITSISEDVFAVTDETKPYLTHSRREIIRGNCEDFKPRVNNEKLFIEQRKNGEKPVFIKNEYEMNRVDNGSSKLLTSEVSSPELEEIAQNSYLLPYVSPKNKFANRMAQSCIKDADFVMLEPDVALYKKPAKTSGYYSRCGVVYVNLKSSSDLAYPRESLTDTIAHEVEHAKWDEKCAMYDMYKSGFDGGAFLKFFSKEEIADIKRYHNSIQNYIPPEVDIKAYRNQFCERVAFDAGHKAVRKYTALKDAIEKTFPNMHGFQFHPPVQEDDIAGLTSFINSLK